MEFGAITNFSNERVDISFFFFWIEKFSPGYSLKFRFLILSNTRNLTFFRRVLAEEFTVVEEIYVGRYGSEMKRGDIYTSGIN